MQDFCINVWSTNKFPLPLSDNWIGIDYGSKLAGTTVIAFLMENEVFFMQSPKGVDADEWLIQAIEELPNGLVCLDAPLSLPAVFRGMPGEDYFYRQADRQTGAMSPMFLGGLTARAMRLTQLLKERSIEVCETYPGYLARNVVGLNTARYKKDDTYLEAAVEKLYLHGMRSVCKTLPTNWHQFDALLALYSASRVVQGHALSFGTSEEGLIFV